MLTGTEFYKKKYNLEAINNPNENTFLPNARFFVIKSFNEENIFRALIHSIWSSTPDHNKKLNEAYKDATTRNYPIILFFSVNSSSRFCGCAQMISPVDPKKDFILWSQQNKW